MEQTHEKHSTFLLFFSIKMDTNAKVYIMKSTILTILISLSFLFSRSQEKVNNQFEKQVLKYFGVSYSVNKKKTSNCRPRRIAISRHLFE